MAKTISQRISLEGSEDIRKKLEQLGKTGEQAFKQIQDAAKQPITDPAQLERTQQAVEQLVTASQQLARQFSGLGGSTQQFGATGTQAANQVTSALNETGKAAEQVGSGLQQSAVKFGAVAGAVAGVFQAATSKLIGIIGQLRAAFAPGALLKGVVESGKEISDQADKIKASIPQWLALRKEIAGSAISVDDFAKSAGSLVEQFEKARGGVARLSDTATETTHAVEGGAITILRFNQSAKQGKGDTNDFATALAKLGSEGSRALRLFASGDTQGALKATANGIANIVDGQKRAVAGTKLFGANWQEMVKILRGGAEGINDVVEAQKAANKAARDLTADQVTAATALKEKWDDLGLAVRSLKDNLGALFIGGADTRAEWLTKLVDKSRELVQTWSKLAEEKKAAFLEKLGESPAEVLFKILIALGQQLSALWRDVLVPAGQALMNIFKQISDQFEGVSKSQVAAFFITAAIAATGLAVALGAIQLVLAPLLALFSPFGAILLAAGAAAFLFWDQISEGAAKAAALVPNSLALIGQSFRRLFAGDFRGFWRDFSEGAVAAFKTIGQAIMAEIPAIKTLMDSFGQIAKDLPGAFVLAAKVIAGAFVVLGEAAKGVADTINAVFGTELTGTDIGVLVILGQITGAFSILSGVILTVVGVVAGLVTIFGGPFVAAIGGLIALVAILATQFPQAWEVTKAAFVAFWNNFTAGLQIISNAWQGFTQIFMAGLQIISNTGIAIWDAIKNAGVGAFNAINSAISSSIEWIKGWVDWINVAIDKLLRFLGLGGDNPNPGQRGATGSFAGGGRVGGRGTGTSDSNLAWVSRGEHIMPARAVRQPGVLAFLEALRRSGGNLSRVLDGMGRFAMGGLALPRFAEGGLNGMSNVTIQFPGLQPIGGLRAPADVVEELRKAAAMAQVRSGGRKPSRYS